METSQLEFHHVGILVSSTKRYLDRMPRAQLFETETFDDQVQAAFLTLVKLPGYYIELIEPQVDSILFKELPAKENRIHHLCFVAHNKDVYLDYTKKTVKIAGPYSSIMFNANIEFYLRSDGIIEEIVKKF